MYDIEGWFIGAMAKDYVRPEMTICDYQIFRLGPYAVGTSCS